MLPSRMGWLCSMILWISPPMTLKFPTPRRIALPGHPCSSHTSWLLMPMYKTNMYQFLLTPNRGNKFVRHFQLQTHKLEKFSTTQSSSENFQLTSDVKNVFFSVTEMNICHMALKWLVIFLAKWYKCMLCGTEVIANFFTEIIGTVMSGTVMICIQFELSPPTIAYKIPCK